MLKEQLINHFNLAGVEMKKLISKFQSSLTCQKFLFSYPWELKGLVVTIVFISKEERGW